MSVPLLSYFAGASGTGKTNHWPRNSASALWSILVWRHNQPASRATLFPWMQGQFLPLVALEPEFDAAENYDRLFMGFRQSMDERKALPIKAGKNLIIEGVLAGHPTFRSVMRNVLHGLFAYYCDDTDVAVFWLDLPIDEVFNIEVRKRPQEQQR